LALVAAAGKRGISRDRVIGILWSEAEEDQARHTLSQTIYTLRKDTGVDWISPGPELRLDPAITSEVGDLKDALASGDFETVEHLASGVFLDGFYLAGAPEFERWVEEERARLKTSIRRAVEQAAARADAAKDHAAAIRSWTLLTELDPVSSRYALGRIRSLASSGDRASALAHARVYEETVRRELETDIDPAVRQLVASLRVPTPVVGPAGSSVPSEGSDAGAEAAPTPTPLRYRDRRVTTLALLGLLVLMGGFAVFRPRAPRGAPVLAVGDIAIDPATDTTRLGTVLRDMLATGLSGVEGIQVVANSRLVELLPRDSDVPGSTSNAARRAGAQELIEGELQTEAAGLVLSLRRVALEDGVLRKGYVIRARDRYAIVDSAAAVIARDFGLPAPTSSVAQVRTASATAYALYDEALRAHFGFDGPAAFRLMTAALVRDSMFAMAAYHAWRLSRNLAYHDSVQMPLLERARRLALRTTERERLLIQTSLASVDAPIRIAVALAESLTVKYPTDPDGQMLLGEVLAGMGDFAGGIAAFERAYLLDSVAGALVGPSCRACYAISDILRIQLWQDSAEAGWRAVQRLMKARPDANHWGMAVEPLLRLGRRREAEQAAERGGGPSPGFNGLLNRDLLRWGHYEQADGILTRNALSLDEDTRAEGWWLLLLSLRDQGRLREADTLIHLARIGNTNHRLPGRQPSSGDLALLATEMGRPAQTIRAHRGNASSSQYVGMPSLRARHVSWNLVLAGTAHAAAGDTAVVQRLADSVQTIGGQSNWVRDSRLHWMLRGLLHQMAGRHEQAVDAFRRSLYSVTDGYTRTNLMLARSLLALRRPEEAIAVLRPAIRGGVDGGNTYVSRTELREALAQAFEMAGQADSARVWYGAVESAWRRADPQFRERYLTAKRKAGL
jgi:DNA-binding SARP family transcriptional activator/tetratricopeptide (TPR) repeat protein